MRATSPAGSGAQESDGGSADRGNSAGARVAGPRSCSVHRTLGPLRDSQRETEALHKAGRATDPMPPANLLAISGGGDAGAFTVGILSGWTARGDRPQFRVVTGVSTGALIAPFAFLGPDYDDVLRTVATTANPQEHRAQAQQPDRSYGRRHGQQRAAREARREARYGGHACGNRTRVRPRPCARDRHHRSRCRTPSYLEHGRNCVEQRSKRPRVVSQSHDRFREHSRTGIAGVDRCRGGE